MDPKTQADLDNHANQLNPNNAEYAGHDDDDDDNHITNDDRDDEITEYYHGKDW
jgi:hypothetical protein